MGAAEAARPRVEAGGGAAERGVGGLQTRHGELEAELGQAGRSGDHERLRHLGDELAAVGVQLSDAEERWLEAAAAAEERGLQV